MSCTPKPRYRKDRKSWFVTIRGKRHNLGPDRRAAFHRFNELMANPAPTTSAPIESVFAIIDAFLDWTAKNRAPRTFDWYLERCQSFVDTLSDPQFTVNQLRPYHVQQWLDAHDSWSNGHKRGSITALRRTFNWAMKMGYCANNPVAAIEKPPAGIGDRVVSRDEFD